MAAALFSHYRNCGTCGSSSSQGGSHVPILIFKLNCCKFQIVLCLDLTADAVSICKLANPMFKRLVQDDGWCVMCVQPQPGHYSCIYHPAGVHMRRRPRYPGSCSSALHGPSSPPATGSPQLQAAAVPGDTEVSTGGHLHTPWTPPAISWPCEVQTPSRATSCEGQFTQPPLGQ